MQRHRNLRMTCFRILRKEPAAQWIEVPRTQIVEIQIAVILLAAIQVRIRRRTRGVDCVAPCIEIIGISDCARSIGQRTDASHAVVAVETGCPGTTDELALADALEAKRIAAAYRSAGEFLDHLRVAGRIEVIHQVASGHAVRRLDHAIAIAIVDDRHRVAVHRHRLQSVLEVVGEIAGTGLDRAAVAVVLLC